MKKILFFIFVIVLTLFVGCTDTTLPSEQTSSESIVDGTSVAATAEQTTNPLIGQKYDRTLKGDYWQVKNEFKQDQIHIQYPQFFGLPDKKKQDELNEFIAQDALKHILHHEDFGDIVDDIGYSNREYKVTLSTPELISIFYVGEEYMKGGMHPYPMAQCLTIDVNTMRVLKLSDFVTVDEAFISRILASDDVFSTRDDFTKQQIIEILHRTVESIDAEPDFYVTPNSIGILMPPAGCYVWVEIKDEKGDP